MLGCVLYFAGLLLMLAFQATDEEMAVYVAAGAALAFVYTVAG